MDVSIFDKEDFNFWVYDKSDQILGGTNLENLTQKEELIRILRVHADYY